MDSMPLVHGPGGCGTCLGQGMPNCGFAGMYCDKCAIYRPQPLVHEKPNRNADSIRKMSVHDPLSKWLDPERSKPSPDLIKNTFAGMRKEGDITVEVQIDISMKFPREVLNSSILSEDEWKEHMRELHRLQVRINEHIAVKMAASKRTS